MASHWHRPHLQGVLLSLCFAASLRPRVCQGGQVPQSPQRPPACCTLLHHWQHLSQHLQQQEPHNSSNSSSRRLLGAWQGTV
jgi:hypothetical protein